jgi:DNA replication protein DnaC
VDRIGRRGKLVVCGPSGTGKTFLLEGLGQQAVEQGMNVAWFTLEQLGVLVGRHRADDSVSKAIGRVLRADQVVVDLCRARDYAEVPTWRRCHQGHRAGRFSA